MGKTPLSFVQRRQDEGRCRAMAGPLIMNGTKDGSTIRFEVSLLVHNALITIAKIAFRTRRLADEETPGVRLSF